MSSALAAAPALSALSLQAQGQAPDIGNLRVEKDIVFGKGGAKDLTLDVYRPPTGVTSKRVAIVHLFGGGFFVGNKNAGYIINDAKALGRSRLHEHLGELSAPAGKSVAGADSRHKGRDPLDPRQRRTPRRRSKSESSSPATRPGGMLSLMAAATNGRKEFEGDGGNAGGELGRQRLHWRLSPGECTDRDGALPAGTGDT
jgi:hypothetical protein